jgi:hypothetical protein
MVSLDEAWGLKPRAAVHVVERLSDSYAVYPNGSIRLGSPSWMLLELSVCDRAHTAWLFSQKFNNLHPADFRRKGVMAFRHDQLPINIPDRPFAG